MKYLPRSEQTAWEIKRLEETLTNLSAARHKKALRQHLEEKERKKTATGTPPKSDKKN